MKNLDDEARHADAHEDTLVLTDPHQVQNLAGPLGAGYDPSARGFLHIQHGCDHACSFCLIPTTQGPSRSVAVDAIVKQAQDLTSAGLRELVLIGDDVASYGADIGLCDDRGTGLTQVLEAIFAAVPDILRVRLGVLDPVRLDQGFFDLLAREPKLMGHLHLSLQAGDDAVLKNVNRRHSVDDIDAVLKEARNARPNIVFGADLIAGFPGETEDMFAHGLSAIKRWNLTYVNVFPYSTNLKTPAATILPLVSGDDIKQRAQALQSLSTTALDRHLQSLTGSVHAVLMETEDFGRTESFAPVRLAKPIGRGQVVNVAVTAQRGGELLGAPMGDYTTASGDKAGGWLKKMKTGLGKSSARMTSGIGQVFTVRRRLDDDVLEQLEEVLISADIGVSTATKLTANLAKTRFDKEIDDGEVRSAFAQDIEQILADVAKPLEINTILKPHVVLVCGVNGSGKTTTIGKLAKQYSDAGKSVMLAAGDTFRAAAIEQLQVWGERVGAPVMAREIGADSAGLAFDALQEARSQGVDVLLVDTAGRLQNKTHLMEELEKVVRVLKKIDDTTPHDVVLVLDATVGQNAHAQVEIFKKSVNVSGLVMTKLDGTAKGGVVVALADKFGLPVHAIGVGEGADDLRAFNAKDFARNLMGLD